jgi:hypothetical protein
MTMKKTDKKSSFGMLSVKAGIDNNPNPTHADKIAGAKMKTKKAKKGKMFRSGGNVLVPFIDYKSIAGMGDKPKSTKKIKEIKEKNKKVADDTFKGEKPPISYTSKKIKSKAKKTTGLPVPAITNPRYSDADALRSYEQSETPKPKKTIRKQNGAPTFPAITTVPGATSSIMKRTTEETPRARTRREMKEQSGRIRTRQRESRKQFSDFFSGLLGSLGSQKAYPSVLDDIAEPYRRKKGGPLGVKMAKGGFKKKTPIY